MQASARGNSPGQGVHAHSDYIGQRDVSLARPRCFGVAVALNQRTRLRPRENNGNVRTDGAECICRDEGGPGSVATRDKVHDTVRDRLMTLTRLTLLKL